MKCQQNYIKFGFFCICKPACIIMGNYAQLDLALLSTIYINIFCVRFFYKCTDSYKMGKKFLKSNFGKIIKLEAKVKKANQFKVV